MVSPQIIAVTGFQNSGKGTVGVYLCKSYGYQEYSFAGSLKDACAAIFNWDREMIEGATKDSREKREIVDGWWADKLNIPDFSPRRALQCVGTELFREQFNENIWLFSLQNRVFQSKQKIVITDTRFKNEVELVSKLEGIVIAIIRGKKPNWWDIALEANAGSKQALQKLHDLGIHASEFSWIGLKVNYVINNDGSIKDLYNAVDIIINGDSHDSIHKSEFFQP